MDNVLTVGGLARGEERSHQLSLNQEASQKELEGVRKMAQRRMSPRRSSGSESAAISISTSPGPTLKKAKNERASIYNCSLFIEVFRELSKHTPYIYYSSIHLSVSGGHFVHQVGIYST